MGSHSIFESLAEQSDTHYLNLEVWISEDLKWDTHISKICQKAYPRIKVLTKLKYVGSSTEDLIDIYTEFIRSLDEYASTTFHSSLTQKLENKLESIQKTSLRVILGDMYVTHEAALEICGLETLHLRRERK